jgi:hypothetical protein
VVVTKTTLKIYLINDSAYYQQLPNNKYLILIASFALLSKKGKIKERPGKCKMNNCYYGRW